MAKRLQWIFFKAHTEPVELWLSFLALFWGLWLLSPFTDVFLFTSIYSTMGLAPEWTWGLAATAIGLAQLILVMRGDPSQRHRAMSLAAFFWGVVSGVLIAQNWRWTSSVVYPAITLLAIWADFRLKTNLRPLGTTATTRG